MWGRLIVLLALSYARGDVRLDPLVVTTQGLVKGLRTDEDYSLFLGIPYARINEDNPFGVAEPYPYSDAIYEAYEDPPECPQMLGDDPIGNLDCLRLNIYVPNKASSRNKLPVIVWLHGGSFNIGYNKRNNYGAQYLVKHDVIIVSPNYRLGVYGFMCLDTPEVPGNQGIKDQLRALRWIRDNIAAFGGDVNKITIMGESAGSASVEAHIVSKTEKLFNNVILQSGTLFKPQVISEPDLNLPIKIAEQLGFKTDNNSEALTFLSRANHKLVIAATSMLSPTLTLCLEKEFENVENILVEMPYKTDAPKVNGINVLAGYTSREGLVMNAKIPNDFLESSNYFRETLGYVFKNDGGFDQMVNIVHNFYVADANLSEDDRSNIIDFKSDYFYNNPLQMSLRKLLQNGANSVYQYLFSYVGNLNHIKNKYNISLEGASHGDELGYLFIMSDYRTPSAEDQMVIDRMATIWTNFAKYGKPVPSETELLPVTWDPITDETVPCLNIDSELTIISRPFNRRLAFWELFYTANENRLRDLTINDDIYY
ncbi:esterase FE4-like [Vanessa cardui]|uniref:esterase FE4-like n=1 Tax=Vanessa cardui TaxID=171605 RepID=UPI001F12902F|nr:esterase FE4-like [Vanessa cardui]